MSYYNVNYRELAWYNITSYYVLQIPYHKAKFRTLTTMLTSAHIAGVSLNLEGPMFSSLPQCEPAFTCMPTAQLSWNSNSREGSSLKIQRQF